MNQIIVKTNYGPVQGKSSKTDDGVNYYAFQGIPYATQPEGDLRYRDPKPVQTWNDVLDATKEGPPSYCSDIFNPYDPKYGGEDKSLVLNVFTPTVKPNKPLPVFIWIHGGGFIAGSSNINLYGPDYLIENELIVVTLNYRLGVTGFLSFRDPSVGIPGNAGLKDQYMAIKWVKENISHFGGNAKNITLAGDSAGGASVQYHLVSPLSKGLFKRGIVHSGSAFNPWAGAPANSDYSLELAKSLGWNGEGGDSAAFNVIASADIRKVYEASDQLVSKLDGKVFGFVILSPFLPKVEPYESDFCFLPKPVLELGRDAWSKDIDIIIGGTADEGLMFCMNISPEAYNLIKQNSRYLVPVNVREKLNEHESKASGDILRNVYFWKSDPTDENFILYESDHQFWHGLWRFICQRYGSGGTGKTFTYWFDGKADPALKSYQAIRDYCQVPHLKGCCHADDLPLIFRTSFNGKPKPENESYQLFNQYQKMYTSFIKTGDPNVGLPDSVKWYPHGEVPIPDSDNEDYDDDEEGGAPRCLKISNEKWEMVKLPVFDRMLIWDGVYDREDLY